MANCICVSYGGKGYTLHGACPVHGPQPAPAEDAERSKLALDLATAALNALPHEIRQRMNDMAKAHHVLIVAAIERVLAEHDEQERQAALKLSEETFEEHFPGGVAEFRRLEKAESERSTAVEELLAAAEELAADLEYEDIHCERLRAAISRVRGLKP